jgi:apolipoprotein N-acyltransferase
VGRRIATVPAAEAASTGADTESAPLADASPPPNPARRFALTSERLNSRWSLALAGLVAGLGLDAAFQPLAWWPLAVPAVAVLMLAARGRSVRTGLLIGFAAGVGEFVPLLAWLHVVTPLAWVALALVEAMYLALLGAGLTVIVDRLPAWPVWAACLWVAEELTRDRWPLGGFAWGRLAFSQPDTPFTRFAALGGAPAVTFVVALSAGLLAFAVVIVQRRPAAGRARRQAGYLGAGAVAAALVVPIVGLAVPTATNGRTVQIALVQGNVPHAGTQFLGRAEEVLNNHVAETAVLSAKIATGQLPAPQLVIWPENASDVDPFDDAHAYTVIQDAAVSVGVPILVGAVLQDGPDHVSNTGIVWDPLSGPGQRYTKRHLVPFGEYIPWRGFIDHLTSLTSLVPQNFAPGHSVGTLTVGPVTLADVMCFEVAFDNEVRDGVTHGGQLIVVQTNNATYMHTAETRQQLAMSQLRAIEHGRSVVVAATSGISAVIAPNGHVKAQTGELIPGIIDMPVVERSARTLADRVGAAPEWVLSAIAVLALAVALARRRSAVGTAA